MQVENSAVRADAADIETLRAALPRVSRRVIDPKIVAMGRRRPPPNALERFRSSYSIVPGPIVGSPCWLWNGRLDADGYGRSSIGGKKVLANRFSLETVKRHGPLGDKLAVHNCHVKDCVNPDHLRPDDRRANFEDAKRAGAVAMGKGSRPRKLSGELVALAFGMTMLGYSAAAVANEIGCSVATVLTALGRRGRHKQTCEPALIAWCDQEEARERAEASAADPPTPMTPEEREAMVAFLPVAIAVLKEQGDLDDEASVEELVATDWADEAGPA